MDLESWIYRDLEVPWAWALEVGGPWKFMSFGVLWTLEVYGL